MTLPANGVVSTGNQHRLLASTSIPTRTVHFATLESFKLVGLPWSSTGSSHPPLDTSTCLKFLPSIELNSNTGSPAFVAFLRTHALSFSAEWRHRTSKVSPVGIGPFSYTRYFVGSNKSFTGCAVQREALEKETMIIIIITL